MSQKFYLYANLFLNDRYPEEVDEKALVPHLQARMKEGIVVLAGNTFNLTDRSLISDSPAKKFQRICQAYPLLTYFFMENRKKIIFLSGKYDKCVKRRPEEDLIETKSCLQVSCSGHTLHIENGYKAKRKWACCGDEPEPDQGEVICLANSFESYINENVVHLGTIRPSSDKKGNILDETLVLYNKGWKVKQDKVILGTEKGSK